MKHENTSEAEQLDCAFTRGALCGKTARRDLRGGRQATDVPTLIGKKNENANTKTMLISINDSAGNARLRRQSTHIMATRIHYGCNFAAGQKKNQSWSR